MVHFVTPLNHGDFYRYPTDKRLGTNLAYLNNIHCQLPISTCLTFLTTKSVLRQTRCVFASYARNHYDFVIFAVLTRPGIFLLPPLSLLAERHFVKSLFKAYRNNILQIFGKRRYTLAVAIDPVGTHLQFDEVGPGVDWETIIQQYLKSS